MLEQPENSIVLKEDIIKATENARANISILESKATILQSANFAMQKDNSKLLKEKEYLQEQIVIKTDEHNNLLDSIVELNTTKEELKSSILNISKEIDEKLENQKNKEEDYNNKKQVLDADTEILKSNQIQLIKDIELFNEEKSIFESKVKTLKEVVSVI